MKKMILVLFSLLLLGAYPRPSGIDYRVVKSAIGFTKATFVGEMDRFESEGCIGLFTDHPGMFTVFDTHSNKELLVIAGYKNEPSERPTFVSIFEITGADVQLIKTFELYSATLECVFYSRRFNEIVVAVNAYSDYCVRIYWNGSQFLAQACETPDDKEVSAVLDCNGTQ